MPERDPACTCLWSPVRGRIWCQHCRTSGPLTESRADASDEQAFLDLHAGRVVPPVTVERDTVDRPVETVKTGGLL